MRLSIGAIVQYQSNDHRAIAKGTIVSIKNGKALVQWGTGYRAHKSTIALKNLTEYDPEKAEAERVKMLSSRHHCGVHGVSVSERCGWVCQFCDGVTPEIIDGNEHRSRRKSGYKYAECVYRSVL